MSTFTVDGYRLGLGETEDEVASWKALRPKDLGRNVAVTAPPSPAKFPLQKGG